MALNIQKLDYFQKIGYFKTDYFQKSCKNWQRTELGLLNSDTPNL